MHRFLFSKWGVYIKHLKKYFDEFFIHFDLFNYEI